MDLGSELGNRAACDQGISTDRSPEMIHVWLVDHPEGRFAAHGALAHQLTAPRTTH